MTKPTVVVLSLGGTIASRPDNTGLAGPQSGAADLIAAVPQLDEIATIEYRDLACVPSCDLTFDIALQVVSATAEAVTRGASGVVVTQGTDTIEEMSFSLDLLVPQTVPVVMTGAMRHGGQLGADGPANLLAAVRTAASPAAAGLGTLVVLNDEIHSAVAVRKRHTSSPSAFVSDAVGPVGWIAEGAVHVRARPFPRLTVRLPEGARIPPVPLVRLTMDDDGWWLPALRTAGPPGLVLDGMGGGHVPGWLAEQVIELAARVPVVLASRTEGGEVLTQTYGGFRGSESMLVAGGLIAARSLGGLKARVLLGVLSAAGLDRPAITQVFQRMGTIERRSKADEHTQRTDTKEILTWS